MSENWKELSEQALRVRERIIRMSTDGGCFIGASLSCADLIVYLYNRFLNLNADNLDDPERDYMFLSKGHDVPALYGTLVERGLLEPERLANHLKPNDHIYWHPNTKIPGIEFHSGSLGHLLSVAAGVAYDCKMKGQSNRIVVMVGDGELDEGSNWEALLVAHAYKLSNLLVLVDRNAFQANMRTEDLIPLEPLQSKLEAFGAVCRTIDGHDFSQMHQAFQAFPYAKKQVSVIIAQTIRGKGLPSIQEQASRWFCNFTHDEIEMLLKELHDGTKVELTSEELTVR